jgi:predicted nucleotidyltransferase
MSPRTPAVSQALERLGVTAADLRALCEKCRIRRFELFGSVLRSDFRPDSDVDVLVEFDPDARTSLFEFYDVEQALTVLFGRRVDLVERRAVEKSPNEIHRASILGDATLLYAA